MLREQLGKRSGVYHFSVEELQVETPGGNLPLLSAATLNSMRRLVADDLDTVQEAGSRLPREGVSAAERGRVFSPSRGKPADADATLMRSKYCIRYELGLCPKHQGAKPPQELYLLNNGRRLALHFDCAACEMTVTA